ncbi:tRNA threonylcarbamoyladenosine biosynthesis protein TsaB [Aidingimonas halophila]|uniref:tRNA threonylcarbamoyladenosine biosynthesis protein TsaB n=2 Tax=Aidingimonas halophila TaxID=574349 RepID=A0A1H2UPG4_9GAMM|nr:tRNA threonylcarbamoyladenosine biosynthesis protein TsaB [Aidingimonas halophila]
MTSHAASLTHSKGEITTSMPTLLALDASSNACSVALMHRPAGAEADEVSARLSLTPREHTHRLMPMIDDLLAEASLTVEDLDAIAYGHGPGSFTGLRIAAGIAQGLAYGAEKPLIGVSTLAAMAYAAHRQYHLRYVIPALDARMGEIYVGAYYCHQGQLTPLMDEAVMSPEALSLPAGQEDVDWVGVGSGWKLWSSMPAQLQAEIGQHIEDLAPVAEDMAYLASREYLAGQGQSPHLVQPVYLRDKVAWRR